jgi:ABC-2 type transport system ATP-binding protein
VTAAPQEVVRATSLTRTFDERVAVRDLSLTLHAGEIVVLLGPNGAGKTTTLRMLAGLITPTDGNIVLQGVPLTRASADRLRQHIGFLTESPGLWDRLSVRMNLLTYARLYGLRQPDEAVARVLALVGLSDRTGDPAGALSKGLRLRLTIARALMHEPAIILLDEPTSGLDPASARHIRELVADLRRQGRALLVSTHNLTEAELLADRIAVLNTTLLAVDSAAGLRRLFSGARVDVEVEGPADRWLAAVAQIQGGSATASGSVLTIALADLARIPDFVAHLAGAGARIRRVSPGERTLEEVYLSLVGDTGAAA